MATFKQLLENANKKSIGEMRRDFANAKYDESMSDTDNGKYYHTKSVNVGGDDHQVSIYAEHDKKHPSNHPDYKPSSYTVGHSVSRGYWSHNFYEPPLHTKVMTPVVYHDHEQAIAHGEKLKDELVEKKRKLEKK